MLPALRKPSMSWRTPASTTAIKNNSNEPSVAIDDKTIAVKPAAGPLTLTLELLSDPTMMPPTIPEIIPENKGAPDANAMPRHKGSATKKTTKPEGRSDFMCLKYVCMVCMVYFDL